MPAQRHSHDDIADTLSSWMDDMADEITAGFYEGRASPGNATLTKAQQLAYYQRQFFKDDGTPNHDGRAKAMARVGPDGYQSICRALHDQMTATGITPATHAVAQGHPPPPMQALAPPMAPAPDQAPPPPDASAPVPAPAPMEAA